MSYETDLNDLLEKHPEGVFISIGRTKVGNANPFFLPVRTRVITLDKYDEGYHGAGTKTYGNGDNHLEHHICDFNDVENVEKVLTEISSKWKILAIVMDYSTAKFLKQGSHIPFFKVIKNFLIDDAFFICDATGPVITYEPGNFEKKIIPHHTAVTIRFPAKDPKNPTDEEINRASYSVDRDLVKSMCMEVMWKDLAQVFSREIVEYSGVNFFPFIILNKGMKSSFFFCR